MLNGIRDLTSGLRRVDYSFPLSVQIITWSIQAATLEEFEAGVTGYCRPLEDIDKSPILVIAKVSVCLSCGKADFVVPSPQSESVSKTANKRQGLTGRR